jgi:phosphoribosyl-ATP pyrophosphohydrolase
MAKPTKKKPSPTARLKKRQVKPSNGKQKGGASFDIDFDPADQLRRTHGAATAPLPKNLSTETSSEVLNRLWAIIESRRSANPEISHSARLLSKGTQRVAQKLGEESVECLLELIGGNRTGLIGESADVLYHLLVAWVSAGIRPEEVWRELERRERVSRLSGAEDVSLKRLVGTIQLGTTKIP